MIKSLSSTSKRCLAVTLTIFLCVFGLASVVWQGMYADMQGGLRYADTGLPIISAADGFYYLAHAHSVTDASPPLSRLAAYAARITSYPVEYVAFVLPCFFALGMALWYFAWAQLLKLSISMTVLATLGGSLIPAWVERSRLSWFDTDPIIAFLWHGALWGTACIGISRHNARWLALPLVVLCGGLLAWWWRPGAIILPVCFLLYSLSFLWCTHKKEARVKFFLFMCCLIGGVLMLVVPDALLPHTISHLRNYAIAHLHLVLGGHENLIYASIEELAPVKMENYLRALGGGAGGGIIVLIALLLFIKTYGHAAWYMAPALGMLLLGAMGERFLYIAALPLGFALGTLPYSIQNRWLRTSPRLETTTKICGIFLACAAISTMLYWIAVWRPDAHFRHEHDRIAVALRCASPPGAPVWNWWDDGYFIRARTGLIPLFDGGSQSPLVAWIAARPFVQEDTRFARRWMRFFALRGAHAINPLAAAWGGEENTWHVLEQIFTADNPQDILATLAPVTTPAGDAHQWLFPQGRVFLYLSHRVMRLSQWWMPLGTDRHAKRGTVHTHMDAMPSHGLMYDAATGKLTLPDIVTHKGYTHVQDAYLTDIRPLEAPWPDEAGLYLVASLKSPWIYMTTKEGLRSLPLRLMAPAGKDTEGFMPIAVDYGAAGAWEVRP